MDAFMDNPNLKWGDFGVSYDSGNIQISIAGGSPPKLAWSGRADLSLSQLERARWLMFAALQNKTSASGFVCLVLV